MTIFVYDDCVTVASSTVLGEEVTQNAAGIDALIALLQARKAQL